MNPPSKKYRFNPLRENETISLKGFRGLIAAENLTDNIANLLIKKGTYGDLIVTVEEANEIRAKIEFDSKVDYSQNTVKELKAILDDAGVDYSDAKVKADYIKLAESI